MMIIFQWSKKEKQYKTDHQPANYHKMEGPIHNIERVLPMYAGSRDTKHQN